MLVVVLVLYHTLHFRILSITGNSSLSRRAAFAAYEFLLCVIGVLPPGLEGTVEIALTEIAEAAGVPPVTRHVDCYCLLQFVRIPLMIRWIVVVAFPHVASPAVLRWQHNIEVHYSFRVKYIYTRHPKGLVFMCFVIVWLCGGFTLHCLDPAYNNLWVAVYDAWILLLDAPPRTPDTVLGGLIVMAMSFVGALCMAAVTASLTTAAELDPQVVAAAAHRTQRLLTYRGHGPHPLPMALTPTHGPNPLTWS